MNSSTALDVMVQFKAFEYMPKQGSITAKELGALINLEPSVVGMHGFPLFKDECLLIVPSPPYENAHRDWYCRLNRERHLRPYTKINGLSRKHGSRFLQTLVSKRNSR
jgi:hypothetical protein